jgi:hypothetical protein
VQHKRDFHEKRGNCQQSYGREIPAVIARIFVVEELNKR